ncbi:MAG: hypothetical protein PHH93_00005, partial [Prolixibacteraceae bacterium]|nr:hypothetical protein [Prolixibacteraceae bacterium]
VVGGCQRLDFKVIVGSCMNFIVLLDHRSAVAVVKLSPKYKQQLSDISGQQNPLLTTAVFWKMK